MSQSTHEEESEVEVSEGGPGEEELNGVVDELELERHVNTCSRPDKSRVK